MKHQTEDLITSIIDHIQVDINTLEKMIAVCDEDDTDLVSHKIELRAQKALLVSVNFIKEVNNWLPEGRSQAQPVLKEIASTLGIVGDQYE